MQTMRRIGVQINGKLVGSCDSISKVSSPLFRDILDPWFDIEGFVPEKPSLNKNQQIVLEWLEAYADKDSGDWPMQTIFYMWDCIRSDRLGGEELSALRKLTRIEQFEVLAAFAEWGKKEVAE